MPGDRILHTIPPPEAVRSRLSRLLMEAALLRDPLRVAERKGRQARSPSEGEEVRHAG